jgi:hypothetical protein
MPTSVREIIEGGRKEYYIREQVCYLLHTCNTAHFATFVLIFGDGRLRLSRDDKAVVSKTHAVSRPSPSGLVLVGTRPGRMPRTSQYGSRNYGSAHESPANHAQ